MPRVLLHEPNKFALFHLRMPVANVWLLDYQHKRYLIDCCHQTLRPFLKWRLDQLNLRRPGDLHGVILTHRHSDHAGNAAWLRERFQCPVYCHAEDAPVLAGDVPKPPMKRGVDTIFHQTMCCLEDAWPARSPVDEAFEEGKWLEGFTVFHTPGHTAGSAILWHEPSKVLFTGDTIIACQSYEWWENPTLAKDAFNEDTQKAHEEGLRFIYDEMPPTSVMCAGHGVPIWTDIQEKLKKLGKPPTS